MKANAYRCAGCGTEAHSAQYAVELHSGDGAMGTSRARVDGAVVGSYDPWPTGQRPARNGPDAGHSARLGSLACTSTDASGMSAEPPPEPPPESDAPPVEAEAGGGGAAGGGGGAADATATPAATAGSETYAPKPATAMEAPQVSSSTYVGMVGGALELAWP